MPKIGVGIDYWFERFRTVDFNTVDLPGQRNVGREPPPLANAAVGRVLGESNGTGTAAAPATAGQPVVASGN